MSRRIVLVAVAGVAVLAGVVGWMLGRQIESPAEAAARISPPPASLISVPVELRELSSAVVTRGTIEFDQTTGIEVTGSEAGSSIITRLTKAEGDELVEGDVAIEVAGRPLFVLEGELPVFRSLTPGLEGPDVAQLEEALERLGLDPGPVDGIFGARTEQAIEQLYRDAGYRPPAIDRGDQATLDGARDRVSQAEKSLSSAEAESIPVGLPRSQRLELDRSVAQIEATLAGLRADRSQALAELDRARVAAAEAMTGAEQRFSTARMRHEQAVRNRVHPDTGVTPTAQELEVLRVKRRDAKLFLDDALANVESATAEYDSEARVWAPLISDALVDVEIAKAQRSEAITQASDTGGQDLVGDLREELTNAREDLVLLERDIGTRLPASEVLFLPSLPRLVQRINVKVGDFPQGSVMDVTGSEIAIVSGVSAADRALLELGQAGTLDDPNEGISIEAEIDFIADNPGGPNLSSDRFRVRLIPTGDVPDEVFSQNLRLRIPISSTGGEVLAVPLAALSAAADGSSRVEKLIDPETTELIEVRVGLASAGFVEVEALVGQLDTGDRVIVGRDQPDEESVPPSQDSEDESSDEGSDSETDEG